MHVKAQFVRKAILKERDDTPEFSISNYGFGKFYTKEIPPVTCAPTIYDCRDGTSASWPNPSNYATGDFHHDCGQDLLLVSYGNSGYVKKNKIRPVIFLNNKTGGLYRSDSISWTERRQACSSAIEPR